MTTTEEKKARQRTYSARYAKRHRDELNERNRNEYRTKVRANGKTDQENAHDYYLAHCEELKAKSRAWREKNPERVKANNHRNWERRKAERQAGKKKKKPDLEKAKALFKNPAIAAHLQWLIDKAEKSKKGKPFESK